VTGAATARTSEPGTLSFLGPGFQTWTPDPKPFLCHSRVDDSLAIVNDLGGAHTTDSIIDEYEDVVSRLHAAGVHVYAGTGHLGAGNLRRAAAGPAARRRG
jgi:hypothetical protein